MKRLRSERKERADAKRVAWAKEEARPFLSAIGVDTVWIFRTEVEIHTDYGMIVGHRVLRATLLFVDEEGLGHFEGGGEVVSCNDGSPEAPGTHLPEGQAIKGTFVASFADVVGLSKGAVDDGTTLPPGYERRGEGRKKVSREVLRLAAKP